MNTPLQTIYNYLQSSGALDDWTAHDATTQPAPEVQAMYLEEQAAANNKRILLLKSSASGGNRFISNPVITFAVFGKVGEPPIYANTYAEMLYKKLLEFDHADCVIHIDPLGGVNGAYKMESGRYVFDMEFRAGVDSGII